MVTARGSALRRSVAAVIALGWIAVAEGAVADDPRSYAVSEPPVVVPADDTHTDARVARTHLRWSQSLTWIAGWRPARLDHLMSWFDVGVGPLQQGLKLRQASWGSLAHWSGRLRWGGVFPAGESAELGPITVGARWYRVLDLFDKAPLIHAQTGVEIAISTPWISDASLQPGAGLLATHGPDGEVAGNGWSLRPAEWHGRADLLVCRSWHGEVGVGPELFRSTVDPTRALDYGLRWHANLGVGLACNHRRDRWINDVTVSVQYRARAVLHSATDGRAYRDTVALAVQYAPRGAHAIGVFAAIDPGRATNDFLMFGVRFQASMGGPR